MAETELCERCGIALHEPPVRRNFTRLCPRHLKEALEAAPSFACTDVDLREGGTADEPCPYCDHPKRAHGWDGCERHILVVSCGEQVHDGPCGCREWDPMCTAVESSPSREATVTAIAPEGAA